MQSMNEKFIAYQGTFYTIEWYFDHRGRSEAREFFEQQAKANQEKLFTLFKRMGDLGKIRDETKFRNEGDGVYAFKPQPDRYLSFFFKGRKIIITNAFVKKQDKLPRREKERALRAEYDYQARVNKGVYYEN